MLMRLQALLLAAAAAGYAISASAMLRRSAMPPRQRHFSPLRCRAIARIAAGSRGCYASCRITLQPRCRCYATEIIVVHYADFLTAPR